MSVIVALKDSDGDCWLACDKQVTIDSLKTWLSESQNKIFPVIDRPGCLVGHVGLLRGINILETNNDYIDELAFVKKEIDYQYVVNGAVPIIYAMFKDHKFIADDEHEPLDLKGETFLVADKQIFLIGIDGSVLKIDDSYAIGSGSELALGSLESTQELDMSPVDRLVTAVCAANRNIYCSGDVFIMCDNPAKISIDQSSTTKPKRRKFAIKNKS